MWETKGQFLQQVNRNQNIQIKKEEKGTYQLKAAQETNTLAKCNVCLFLGSQFKQIAFKNCNK